MRKMNWLSQGLRKVQVEPGVVISSVQSLSHVRLLVTLRTAARQASLSITNSWSLLRLTSVESAMPSQGLRKLSSGGTRCHHGNTEF